MTTVYSRAIRSGRTLSTYDFVPRRSSHSTGYTPCALAVCLGQLVRHCIARNDPCPDRVASSSPRRGACPTGRQRQDQSRPVGRHPGARQTRDIDFTTSEGTWMSGDLSPDRTWIAFDLLGHIYRMPAAGGEATALTQNSGVALNFQPRISPDGKTIAFITDRRGQYNLWVMNADGSNQRPVFTDLNATALEPAWTPDGNYIVVTQGRPRRRRRWRARRRHLDVSQGRRRGRADRRPPAGGRTVAAVAANGAPAWPTVSGDGKYLYYQVAMTGRRSRSRSRARCSCAASSSRRARRSTSPRARAAAPRQAASRAAAAAAPEISPDGRWLAFARQIPDGTLEFKGHKYGPRTALWLRDMKTGAERLLMDPIEPMVAERVEDARRAAALQLGERRQDDPHHAGRKAPPARRRDARRRDDSVHGEGASHDLADGAQRVPHRRRAARGQVLPLADGDRRTARRSRSRPSDTSGCRTARAARRVASRRRLRPSRVRAGVEPGRSDRSRS